MWLRIMAINSSGVYTIFFSSSWLWKIFVIINNLFDKMLKVFLTTEFLLSIFLRINTHFFNIFYNSYYVMTISDKNFNFFIKQAEIVNHHYLSAQNTNWHEMNAACFDVGLYVMVREPLHVLLNQRVVNRLAQQILQEHVGRCWKPNSL